MTAYRSTRTQELLNYFDSKDVRVREQPYTVDAQLLNAAAMQLDDVAIRLTRETDARTLATTPIHLDNRGVYWSMRLDAAYELSPNQTTLPTLEGSRNGVWSTIRPFDDRLPTPSTFVLDSSRSRVTFADPILCDITGSGNTQTSSWDVRTVSAVEMPIPNRLTFYLDAVGQTDLFVSILIEGETYPVSVWTGHREQVRESIVCRRTGVYTTQQTWSTVTGITVRGLPAGVRLRCWSMPFTLPIVPDLTRPYHHASYRDRIFDRYWSFVAEDYLLKELYLLDNLSGLEVAQTYEPPGIVTALAIEPRTWGLLVGCGTTLHYTDRREPLPDHLDVTGLTQEPLYGIECQYNFTMPGPVRYLYIRPIPYAQAGQMTLWRYLIQAPDGRLNVLLPDGSLAVYTGGAGWQRGRPTAVSVPLVSTGTYVITIECIDGQQQTTFDSVPYVNLALRGTAYDLSHLVPEIQGLAFDSRERLWVWTGQSAVPIRPQYDAYVLDPSTRRVYLTDYFDELRYT